MLTEDVFTHASIEQASSHRATIEAEHRACIEPQHRASIELSRFSIEHRGRGSGVMSDDCRHDRHDSRTVSQK